MNKYLVAYATKSGSTQDVAQEIAATLREHGVEADVKPAHEVQTLVGYDAVVLGAPIYIGHWHKDAMNFIAHNRSALIQRPIAIFALGPMHTDEKEFQEVRVSLEKELAKFPWLTPITIEIFGGKFDPQTLKFPYNLIPAMKNSPASDIRDWTAIRAWASSLVERFQPALASSLST